MTDAIVRTLYRKAVSRKPLAGGNAADAEKDARHDLPAFFRFMFPVEL